MDFQHHHLEVRTPRTTPHLRTVRTQGRRRERCGTPASKGVRTVRSHTKYLRTPMRTTPDTLAHPASNARRTR